MTQEAFQGWSTFSPHFQLCFIAVAILEFERCDVGVTSQRIEQVNQAIWGQGIVADWEMGQWLRKFQRWDDFAQAYITEVIFA